MSKKNPQPSELSLASSSFEDHPVVEWLSNNGQKILFAVFIFASLLFLLHRYSSNRDSQYERDYFQAANDIMMMKNPEKEQEAFKDLQSILINHPELNAKYEGLIAEELLLLNQAPEAEVYAQRVFDRVSSDLSPFYLSFAKESLLIAEQKDGEALKSSLKLKEDMLLAAKDPGRHFGPRLYLFNLIRIGMLERKLNLKDQELKTWDELLMISKGNSPVPISTSDLDKVIKHFEEQKVNLIDFIQSYNEAK